MTPAHYWLGFIATIMTLEALWGIVSPTSLRKQARKFLDEYSPDDAGLACGGCWLFALLCWAFAWFGQSWAHRLLFFIGVLLTLLGLLVTRRDWLEHVYDAMLGNRHPWFIRVLYTGELLVALLLFAVTIQGG